MHDGRLDQCKDCRMAIQKIYRKTKRAKKLAVTHYNQHRFKGSRKKVLKRDKYKCCDCGMSREEHKNKFKRDITLDHIDGNRKNNNVRNLKTLCLHCHGRKDGRRRKNFNESPTK